ncbi:MAG: hypothetical protein HETSPECPRED_005786 [Heterodermia speciosa]|uniref:Heterokaryon incompatibility domain-containing protein n=1 Tax=Heterodermia speciosa TaxID=116794 RepID=A0A8H3FIL6_9LECA|nr:MAG: hypothetical protein HETSPECPRED_005786 [Heterodermia speciosa]
MYDISITKETDELRGVESNLWDPSRPDDGLPHTTNPIWYDLFAIIRRPWFNRAWVIQELAMAPQATVMCGENKVLWDELEQVFKYLAVSGFALAFAPMALNNFLIMSHARGVARSKVTQSALHVLMRHRQTLASDPRDKVFAFGGLCSATHDDSLAMKPDYGTDFREIYTMFAVSTLLNSQNLDILSVPRVQETSLNADLPSWVPDWSVFDRTTSLQDWEGLVDKKWIVAPRYMATGLSKCKPIFSNSHTRLGLRGIIVECILHAGPECRSKLDQDDLAKTSDLSFVIHSQRVLKTWEDISACRIFWWHYPTGEKLIDVYWQTLLAGHLYESFEKTQQIFQRWDQTNQAFRCLQLVYLDRPWFLSMIIYGMSLAGGIVWFLGWMGVFNYMLNFSPQTLFKNIAWPVTNRSLFKTESGYIGIGPKLIRRGLDGDHIAFCEGGGLPLIVRPSGDEWEIIGDCYVYGWMKGEFYEMLKDDMKMMWFF